MSNQIQNPNAKTKNSITKTRNMENTKNSIHHFPVSSKIDMPNLPRSSQLHENLFLIENISLLSYFRD